jgi:acyl-CoA synthetase (AMP-forming)/AMP-acid ligase II
MVVTGGTLTAHRLRQLSEALPGVAIHIGYGQTETSPRITSLKPTEVLSRPASCGLPVPDVRVEIVDEYGVTLEPGMVGEVVVSGPNVMSGYISRDEISSGKIDGYGRLHTGDLGRVDKDGYLYLTGRNSDLIKCGGERVFPREIEAVLDTHPAVRESAVIGMPDDVFGEKIVACVVLRNGAAVKAEDLRSHCSKFLPQLRVPKEIQFCGELPRTGSGKIKRASLAAHFGDVNTGKTFAA